MHKSKLFLPLVSCGLLLTTLPSLSVAQDKPTLMVLASAHFNNPGRDTINIDVDDVMTEMRQAEIESVVEQLMAFNPTHIAVEVSGARQAGLDERYENYLEGRNELGRGEDDQLGLRLAAKLGHDRVYGVDWNGNPPGDIEADYDWVSYAQANGHEAELAAITAPERTSSFYVELKEQSIGTWLKQLNHPDALLKSHQVYFDIAMVGDGDQLLGANWVGTWYARNLKIYSRLVDMAQSPEDRVLVIYGQGHAYLLQQFARESGAFTLESVSDYLLD